MFPLRALPAEKLAGCGGRRGKLERVTVRAGDDSPYFVREVVSGDVQTDEHFY